MTDLQKFKEKTIKGLTKHNLAKVNNTEEGLFVELV